MSTGMTTEEKAACFDKLVELMAIESPLIAIHATVNGKTIRGFRRSLGQNYAVNEDGYDSIMGMLLEFERRVKS